MFRKTNLFRLLATLLALCVPLVATAREHGISHFEFHNNFWMNLHHTLFREATRIRDHVPVPALDTHSLSTKEKDTWDNAIQYYISAYKDRRLVFDDALVAINNQLAETSDSGGALPPKMDPELKAQLSSVAEIYRKYWWPEHEKTNNQWISTMQPRVEHASPKVTREIAHFLNESFPAQPHRVDVTYYVSEIGGAYTTDHPSHTTLSSIRNQADDAGFEIVFHEATHVITGTLEKMLDSECKKQQKDCSDLWHAVQFYTVGEVVRRYLASQQITYTPYADKTGVWKRGRWPVYRDAIVKAWQPYLDGKSDMNSAVVSLVNTL